jgi:leader peptidase (prepilin peptidase)/N-methyltransferase
VAAVPALTDAALIAATALAGLAVGAGLHRAARAFPWRARAELVPGSVSAEREVASPDPGTLGPLLGRVPTALLAGVLFALAAVRFGPSAELPAWLALAAAGVLLTAIDLRSHLLPDRVVLPSLGAGVVLLGVAAAVEGAWPALGRALLASAALFAAYLVLALLAPGGLGMGDVKLAALLGLYLGRLGWDAVLAGAIAGFVVQAGVALGLLALRRVGLRGELPFGPAMLGGALIGVGWGPELVHAVLGGTGPL